MAGWNTSDVGALPLEALRKSDVVKAVFSPEFDCAVLMARSKGGKERLLGAWSDALHTGIASVADLFHTGVSIEMRSVGMWFS